MMKQQTPQALVTVYRQRDAFTTTSPLQTQLRVESEPVLPTKPELTAGYRQPKQTC